LARQAGAPVKWLESREESLLVGAREYVHRFEVGFDATGKILALRDRILANVGALGPSGGWAQAFVAGLTLPGPYKINDYDVEVVPVATHKAPWNGARGFGKESAALLMERVMDLVAQRLELDPAEVRRRNLIPTAEMPYWIRHQAHRWRVTITPCWRRYSKQPTTPRNAHSRRLSEPGVVCSCGHRVRARPGGRRPGRIAGPGARHGYRPDRPVGRGNGAGPA